MLAIYYGFILVVAFAPAWLGVPLWPGATTTIGIPIGILIIVAAFILTGLYVRRANAEFDALTSRSWRQRNDADRGGPGARGRGPGTPRPDPCRRGRRRDRRGPAPPGQHPGDRDVFRVRRRAPSASPTGPPSAPSSAADFYAAGGGITGFQNGLAIAGDYMSAASFLASPAWSSLRGFDGLIYSIGFLVGWPIILFLIAERLRNLGKYTFADVASFRLRADADPHRSRRSAR